MQTRAALVTGGGTGIGRATARALGEAGWAVTVSGRRDAPLREAVAPLGDRGRAVAGDVTDADDARRMVEETVGAFGRLDLLVNNAALYAPAPVLGQPEEAWRAHFAVNVDAAWRLCRLAHPHLKASGAGSVVNVLSTLAHRATGQVSAYCCSKAALEMLGRCLALEWAGDGIRVNAVSPGVVDTPIHDEARLESMAPAHPLGRVGQPGEIARAVVFLASDASGWITGANLDVDGGIRIA